MYKVAICDDEQMLRERVKQILIGLSVKTDIEFDVCLFESGEQLIAHYEGNEPPFHILILDVEMNGLNGIETARKLRSLNRLDEQIIFLTSYPEYMLDSFDVITFQYLLKPVSPSTLEEKMLKLHQYLQASNNKFMIVKSGYEEILLRYDEIIAIESTKSLTVKNKLHIYTVEQTYDSKGTITDYAVSLKDYHFLQIHRSVVVNLLHVKRFAAASVTMSSGMEFPIGRSKVKEVKDIYTKYMIMKVL